MLTLRCETLQLRSSTQRSHPGNISTSTSKTHRAYPSDLGTIRWVIKVHKAKLMDVAAVLHSTITPSQEPRFQPSIRTDGRTSKSISLITAGTTSNSALYWNTTMLLLEAVTTSTMQHRCRAGTSITSVLEARFLNRYGWVIGAYYRTSVVVKTTRMALVF